MIQDLVKIKGGVGEGEGEKKRSLTMYPASREWREEAWERPESRGKGGWLARPLDHVSTPQQGTRGPSGPTLQLLLAASPAVLPVFPALRPLSKHTRLSHVGVLGPNNSAAFLLLANVWLSFQA